MSKKEKKEKYAIICKMYKNYQHPVIFKMDEKKKGAHPPNS